MYEELSEPLPDLDAYLERIGYTGPVEPTVEVLDALLMAQLLNVPFDDLDVSDFGLIPSLGIADLFDKIVTRRRGGYCFELNGLFAAMLRAIGFEVTPITARITTWVPMPCATTHRGSIVTIDGVRRWCDVGFGGPAPASSVKIDTDEMQHTPTGDFKFRFDGRWHVLDAYTSSGITPTICFDDHEALEVDFLMPNFWCSSHPDSMFRKMRIVNLLTADGNKSINGDVFKIRSDGEVQERKIEGEDDFRAILKEHFGIVYPQVES
ncbi:MAG: arylamine N-acetyltransferase [bacterium]|nr:arylamine N-acetyltransferase [bacterium]